MSIAEQFQALEQLGPSGHWAVEKILDLTLQNVHLQNRVSELEARLARLQAENQKKDEQIEALQKAAHRQAAPFRRPESERHPHPGRPGRKPGHKPAYRPKPEQIDERIHVPLSDCPHCQGPVPLKRRCVQYIEEIPVVRPHVTELTTEEGWCEHCQATVCSTHPLQVSRAEGAAGTHLGPRALALACDLNKAKGLSMRKTVAVLRDAFGLKLTPGGLAQALRRVADKVRPEYDALVEQVRHSPVVHADETSWWVGGPGWWLWVFATKKLTLYVVIKSRAAAVALNILGENFAGTLVSDCLAIYDDLNPLQQKCYSHHLKAVAEARQPASTEGEEYLLQVQALLRTGLWLKALQGESDQARFKLCVEKLKLRAHELLDRARPQPQAEKVRLRLWKQRDHLFTFLERAEVDATNNLAERQLRPAVIARKISCGNKTEAGAQAWQVLASLAATSAQNGRSFLQTLDQQVRLQPSRGP